MKTKIKTSILAIALLASVSGVFASDISNAISGKKLISYTWQLQDRSGTPVGSPISGDESSQFSGCPNTTTTVCAVGTAEDQPTLFRYYSPL